MTSREKPPVEGAVTATSMEQQTLTKIYYILANNKIINDGLALVTSLEQLGAVNLYPLLHSLQRSTSTSASHGHFMVTLWLFIVT